MLNNNDIRYNYKKNIVTFMSKSNCFLTKRWCLITIKIAYYDMQNYSFVNKDWTDFWKANDLSIWLNSNILEVLNKTIQVVENDLAMFHLIGDILERNVQLNLYVQEENKRLL